MECAYYFRLLGFWVDGTWNVPTTFAWRIASLVLIQRNLDLLERVQLALIATWTTLGGLGPVLWRIYGGLPKRPSSALDRSRFINRTGSRVRIEEDTIAIRVLD